MHDLLDRFGLQGLINASGTETMHGSTLAPPEVRHATPGALAAVELGDDLLSGDQRKALRRTRIGRGILALDVRGITDGELDHLATRVREILVAARLRGEE